MARFVIREVITGVKFDLLAPNGQDILTSGVYACEAACRKGIASVVKNAAAAGVADQTGDENPAVKNPRFEVYRDRAGEYRFRLKARNGEIIAFSDGYAGKVGCLEGIESVKKYAPRAEIEEI